MPFKQDLLEALPAIKKMAVTHMARGVYGFDADDLVQETYIRALHGERCYRPNSTFMGWLYTVMRNVFLTMIRRRRNLVFIGLAEDFDTPCREDAERFSFSDGVDDILHRLGKGGEVLRMQALGLTTAEISSVTGLPNGTIFSTAARAREEFKEIWCRNARKKRQEIPD
jgi:RNA polymerase sigma-70 factor (ECF subfamily)